MNLALHFCWKEWRAQRGLLTAYSLLVFACLCLGFLLVPDHVWEREGNRIAVLSVFVAAGVVGVVMFAAPQLVRGEFTGKDDLFMKRLPGALLPAYWGKLLFLLLVAVSLPLLGLCVGMLFLQATGHFWDDLFWIANLGLGQWNIGIRWPDVVTWLAVAMVALPWVWVVAMWLPGGRMALGGAVLLFLVLGLGVFAVLRQCPTLDQTIGSWHWLWPVWPLGLTVGALSWGRGRRGGGIGRSARFGLAALGLAIAPPAGWFGSLAYEYHHPDLQHLADMRLCGVTPDLRYALGEGAARPGWCGVPVRIDLQTGVVEQLGSIYTWCGEEVLRPYPIMAFAVQRYWRLVEADSDRHTILDLATGERRTVGYDQTARQVSVPAELLPAIAAEVRARTRLRAPGGMRAWLVGKTLHVEQADGSVTEVAWPGELPRVWLRPAGHGIQVDLGPQVRLFDLTRMRDLTLPSKNLTGIEIGDHWLLHRNSGFVEWQRCDPDRCTVQPLPELARAGALAPLDADRLLMRRHEKFGEPEQLLVYRLGDRHLEVLPVVEGLPVDQGVGWSLANGQERDGRGRLWLRAAWSSKPGTMEAERRVFFAFDPTTLRCEPLPIVDVNVLAFVGGSSVLAYGPDRSLLRIDYTTGERTVLFPRAEVAK